MTIALQKKEAQKNTDFCSSVTTTVSKNEQSSKVSSKKSMDSNASVGIKKHLTDKEIASVFEYMKSLKNIEHALVFRLVLATGAKIAEIKKIKWGDCNLRLGRIAFKNRMLTVPAPLSNDLAKLRDKIAISEDQFIFKSIYRENWRGLKTCLDRFEIDTKPWLAIRYSYIARFMKIYGDKKKLKAQLGLTTLRHVPKYILNTPKASLDLFQIDTAPSGALI